VESINLSSFLNIRSFAAGIALVISWYTEDMILTISGGMITLWLLNFLS
jgi:branched-subunit amino acid transport protein